MLHCIQICQYNPSLSVLLENCAKNLGWRRGPGYGRGRGTLRGGSGTEVHVFYYLKHFIQERMKEKERKKKIIGNNSVYIRLSSMCVVYSGFLYHFWKTVC